MGTSWNGPSREILANLTVQRDFSAFSHVLHM